MYCDKCGTPLTPGAQFCSSCGKAAGAAPIAAAAGAVRQVSEGRVQRHIRLLASLWLATGILRFAEVAWVLLVGRMLPFFADWGNGSHFTNFPFDFMAFGIYSIAGLLALFGVAHLILAWGVFQREPWARTPGLVIGFWRCCVHHLGRRWEFIRFGCCCRSNRARSTSGYRGRL
jgi:hypothetical protein